MPAVKLPTSEGALGNHSGERSWIIPFAVQLPLGWDAGLMAQFDIARDVSGGGYHPEFIQTVTLGHDIVGKLGGYVEFFSAVSAESDARWVGTIDVGLTYGLTDNIQLDAGVNVGVTSAGPHQSLCRSFDALLAPRHVPESGLGERFQPLEALILHAECGDACVGGPKFDR